VQYIFNLNFELCSDWRTSPPDAFSYTRQPLGTLRFIGGPLMCIHCLKGVALNLARVAGLCPLDRQASNQSNQSGGDLPHLPNIWPSITTFAAFLMDVCRFSPYLVDKKTPTI
jgi:hypothetical protein